MSWLSAVFGAVLLSSSAGCVRDPLTSECADVDVGDLVVSELRGDQDGSYRQWIELYNAGDAPVQLAGLRLLFTESDGSTLAFFVRGDLEVAPGTYVTLGGGATSYIDYDYTVDLHSPSNPQDPSSLPGSAVLELHACDHVVDTVHYTGLPSPGTLALDGAATPDASANDDTKAGWCVDVRTGEGPQTAIGIRGTPQEANPPCV